MSIALSEMPSVAERGASDGQIADEKVFVTLTVAGQLCGVPALTVRDILGEQTITRIPMAPREIAGSLNLRGRIVTAVDLRRPTSAWYQPVRPAGSADGADQRR